MYPLAQYVLRSEFSFKIQVHLTMLTHMIRMTLYSNFYSYKCNNGYIYKTLQTIGKILMNNPFSKHDVSHLFILTRFLHLSATCTSVCLVMEFVKNLLE